MYSFMGREFSSDQAVKHLNWFALEDGLPADGSEVSWPMVSLVFVPFKDRVVLFPFQMAELYDL